MQLFQLLGAHQKNYSKSYVVIILRAAFEIQHKLRTSFEFFFFQNYYKSYVVITLRVAFEIQHKLRTSFEFFFSKLF